MNKNYYMRIAIRTYISNMPSNEMPVIEAETREAGYFRRLFRMPVRCSARRNDLSLDAIA